MSWISRERTLLWIGALIVALCSEGGGDRAVASGSRHRRVARIGSRHRAVRRGSRHRAVTRRHRSRRCRHRGDRLVPLRYLQGGSVWIPAEARCGGRFPVVVLLHGNNTSRETVKSLGGGRNLDRWARRYLNGKLIQPVILAEPIHFGACANERRRKGLPYLFTGRFDFRIYRRKLEAVLRANHIRPSSWSFIGHSGAACCLAMGMFAIHKVWPKVKIWASADGCYRGDLQAASILRQFGKAHTRIFNACRGAAAYPGYRSYERTLLGHHARPVRCDRTYYETCRRSPKHPWFSFTTRFHGPEKHSKVLVELFKTVLFHEFPSPRRRRLAAARQARARRLAARRQARARRLAAVRQARARRLAARRQARRLVHRSRHAAGRKPRARRVAHSGHRRRARRVAHSGHRRRARRAPVRARRVNAGAVALGEEP